MGKKPKNSPPAVCGTKDPAAPPGTALLECLDSECQILFARIFQLLAHWTGKGDVIGEILRAVRGFTDLEAAGIRVREGDDYPYFVTDGFSEKFVEAENSLCSRNQNGQIVCDDRGSAVLECMCGEVIRGEVDTSLPFFTPAGSFWTNHRSKLLASDFAKHIKCRIRNRFNAKGYESVAIICLRCDREPVGLLQLYDTRPDCLSRELLSFLEGVGHIIGIVLARISAEEKLSRANDDLEKLVDKRTAELQASKRLLEQEIQERIAIQNELRMSHERLELAMRSGKLGSWDWNLRSNEVFFDQRWSTMFGYPTEDVHPDVSSWQNLIHREDKLRVLNTLKSHVDNLTPAYEAEYRLQGKTGEYRWILDRGKVVERAEDGKALRMAGIYLDITERKRIEEQLVESTAHIRGILESVRDCIFVKNAALEYTLVNPYLVNMLGLPESEIVGRTDRDLFGRQVSESLRDTDRRVLRGEYVEQEHTRTVNGTPTTFLDIKVPMRDSQDKIIGIIGISRDITDRKLTQSSPPTLDPDFDSPSMRSTLRAARLAADTDSIVLLMGESGCGKDYLARYIHKHSKRATGPFFSINCAAVSPELAESELFGYEAGAFTGARGPKRGMLELAEGGTILLNEIGEMSLALQAKLLTFLDTRQFTRVGGEKILTVNARLIAATNRDLLQEVKQKRFRHDLLYRIDVFTIDIPPLRQRAEDIPDLVKTSVRSLCVAMGLDYVPQIDSAALKALSDYSWPGNVRELRNVLERALILCDKRRITLQELTLNSKMRGQEPGKEWSFTINFPYDQSLNTVTMDVKRVLVEEALKRTDGSRIRAADLLGISVDSLKHYMRIFGLYR